MLILLHHHSQLGCMSEGMSHRNEILHLNVIKHLDGSSLVPADFTIQRYSSVHVCGLILGCNFTRNTVSCCPAVYTSVQGLEVALDKNALIGLGPLL